MKFVLSFFKFVADYAQWWLLRAGMPLYEVQSAQIDENGLCHLWHHRNISFVHLSKRKALESIEWFRERGEPHTCVFMGHREAVLEDGRRHIDTHYDTWMLPVGTDISFEDDGVYVRS